MGADVLRHDLTELAGLDMLGAPDGCIAAAQTLASATFGSDKTWFLVNGSTVGVHAAVLATCVPGDVVVLARNAHQSAFLACVLAGTEPEYCEVEVDTALGVAHGVTAKAVRRALEHATTSCARVGAVLIVSPTYFGACSDVSAVAAVCGDYGVPLVVDEAHGAHLGLHPSLPPSALQQGADVVVQSTHKVLGAMTQCAMLHTQGDRVDPDRVSRALQVLQSSSPSYVLMASLDAARQQVQQQRRHDYGDDESFVVRGMRLATDARRLLRQLPPLRVLDDGLVGTHGVTAMDPMRVTVDVGALGISGFAVERALDERFAVIAELAQPRCVTFVFSGGNSDEDVRSLVDGLARVVQELEVTEGAVERIAWEEAAGYVSAELLCPYPPGIPAVAPGELLTAEVVGALRAVVRAGGRVNGASDGQLNTFVVLADEEG